MHASLTPLARITNQTISNLAERTRSKRRLLKAWAWPQATSKQKYGRPHVEPNTHAAASTNSGSFSGCPGTLIFETPIHRVHAGPSFYGKAGQSRAPREAIAKEAASGATIPPPKKGTAPS